MAPLYDLEGVRYGFHVNWRGDDDAGQSVLFAFSGFRLLSNVMHPLNIFLMKRIKNKQSKTTYAVLLKGRNRLWVFYWIGFRQIQ